MHYDPIKDRFAGLVLHRPRLMRLFFAALHVLFLRAWYVRRALRNAVGGRDGAVRVLDAGTGFGQFAYWLLKHFPTVRIHAVDIKTDYLDGAEKAVTQAGYANRATFGIDDLTRLKAAGPYDLILSVDVMEHIEEDERVFSNFYDVLRPGGVVIINTPSDQGGSDVRAGEDESFIGEHVRDGYSIEGLRAKLERAGLEVERINYTYGRWGSAAWRLSVKWPMLLLNTSWLFVLLLPVYYLPVLPVAMLLNLIDVSTEIKRGSGVLAVARRS